MTGPAAATRKEEALWMLDQLVPGSGVNNLAVALDVEGELGDWELEETLARLLERHATLRTVFRDTPAGLLRHVLGPTEITITLDQYEVTRADLEELLTDYVGRPFAMDGSPLLRAGRFRTPEGDVLCLAVHHLNFDALSSVVLTEELVAHYTAISEDAEPPAELAQPAPVCVETAPSQRSLTYWRDQLAGFDPSGLALWCEAPDVAQPTLTGDRVSARLSATAYDAVRTLARQLRAPEAVILYAAYSLLLSRHGAGRDVVVGAPASLRTAESSRAVGYHINTLPLRLRIPPGVTFASLVGEARGVFLASIIHREVPVEALMAQFRPATGSWRNPVFKHLFNYVPDEGQASYDLGGLRAERRIVENGFSKFDLEFFVISTAGALDVRAVFYTEVLGRADVTAMLARFDALLVTLGQRSGEPVDALPLHAPADLATIGAANATTRPVRSPSVLTAIAARVAAAPTAVAVRDGDREVSYAQIWAAAEHTRTALRAAGVGPGGVVALLGRRGPELVGAVLGTWLAGAAYLPIDPAHPYQRIVHQLDDSGAGVVIADPGTPVPEVPGRVVLHPVEVTTAEPTPVDPATDGFAAGADPAYLIYTSGSTGRPKGTWITHRALANLIEHFVELLHADARTATLWLTTFSFDISALELFLPLAAGGSTVVAPDAARTDGSVLLDVLRQHPVDIVQATPTTWRLVAEQAGDVLRDVQLLSGGEALPAGLARQLAGAGRELHNVYGPTETTIWSTAALLDAPFSGPVHVGTPIANTQVLVVDPEGRELPVGLHGELCIAGAGVAIGYHRRPELTAERFGGHERYGRFYRTGDLARWRPDGTIEVLGRMDRQVKLRGNRIELGEVESVLGEHPAVDAAAVLVHGGADGTLVAFVVGPDPHDAVHDDLWRHAIGVLPHAAVPQEFIVVAGFPTTGNDKVDYPALGRLAEERQRRAREAVRPAAASGDPVVDELITLWQDLLGHADVHAASNFFTAGGHSLLAARLVQQVEARLRVRLALADIFANPTPTALAEGVRAAQRQRLDRISLN
ncbi:amino acid adenylation domain-containing protein [Micromonospora sp. NPDC049081]|uniref:non-ribosomal peptide synthetase n=1 Tax=Micromonospora sp. NPDC049081 TaxID=3155150 RepID=UPI003410D0A2